MVLSITLKMVGQLYKKVLGQLFFNALILKGFAYGGPVKTIELFVGPDNRTVLSC